MLELKDIVKEYVTADETVQALKGVSVRFRKSEFVSVLGPSGCGKTTLLNIVGGLDRYTSGDLVINGKSTKDFTDKDWDTYRNHQVGFVFQSYNLIPHQTVLENVELALTLSGIGPKERRERAIAVLDEVGLKNKINSRPNQLSGGQMQRVAIARALINDPEILLADEPTGALDSKTSVQIMEILKEISKDRLIIMVTHNPELAEKYSSRIIRLLDGELVSDDKPVSDEEAERENLIESNDVRTNKGKKRTSMSFGTALSLSFKNLMTKKARTFLVSFAGSIGIIGIALILSLSSGFQSYIDRLQEDTLSAYPITIFKTTTDYSALLEDMSGNRPDKEEFPATTQVTTNGRFSRLLDAMTNATITNDLASFKNYLDTVGYDKNRITAVQYTYDLKFTPYGKNIYGEENSRLNSIMDLYADAFTTGGSQMMSGFINLNVWSEAIDNEKLIKSQYEVIGDGRWADFDNPNEIMLLVDSYNQIPDFVLASLGLMDPNELLYPMAEAFLTTAVPGFSSMSDEAKAQYIANYFSVDKDADHYEFTVRKVAEEHLANRNFDVNDLLGKEFSLMLPSAYYEQNGDGTFTRAFETDEFVGEQIAKAHKVKIVGVLRLKEGVTSGALYGNIIYTKALTSELIKQTSEAPVIVEQLKDEKTDVLTGKDFMESYNDYAQNLIDFGYLNIDEPASISIYSSTFEDKDYVTALIDEYNVGKSESEKMQYTDYMSIMMSSMTTIINAVSYVLIGFVSVSLIVSSIMIGIITYISVLERIKEIGILRALGASKRDVSRVFNAETFIIGLAAGFIGILVTVLLDVPISLLIYKLADIKNVAVLPVGGAMILIIISMLLTVIAGLIPSRIASKKDPVIALRTE